MPDNAIYYQAAYAAIVVLFVGYAISIRVRRNAVARKLAAAQERR
jgi:type VI protein secretion system component VasF